MRLVNTILPRNRIVAGRFLQVRKISLTTKFVLDENSPDPMKHMNRIPRVRIHPKFPHLRWESVIGLEVHAQIKSNSKLFSAAASPNAGSFGVNSAVALFDAALPGTLPVLNKRCVEAGIKTSLALDCDINKVSHFDRKHYFYSDLPSGYQITQQRAPLAKDGKLHFTVLKSSTVPRTYHHSVGIHQIQLEQDSGKSLHDDENLKSLIDLNRAGTGLMEIVFKPEIFDGEEAACLIKELSLTLQCLDVCSGKMDEGALRVDANISIRPVESDQDLYMLHPTTLDHTLGVRTEVKNLNSIRSLVNAIEFEVFRQIESLERGKQIENETRGFDPTTKATIPMRDKESKQDYRFIPEPNLPPLRLCNLEFDDSNPSGLLNISYHRQHQPELPEETRSFLIENVGLSIEISHRLVNEPEWLGYFQCCMKLQPLSPKVLAHILVIDVVNYLYDNNLRFVDMKLKPEILVELCDLKVNDELSHNLIRKALEILIVNSEGYASAEELIIERKWKETFRDLERISKEVDLIIQEHPKLVKKCLKNNKFGLKKLFIIFNEKFAEDTDMKMVSEVFQSKINEMKK